MVNGPMTCSHVREMKQDVSNEFGDIDDHRKRKKSSTIIIIIALSAMLPLPQRPF